MSMPDAQPDRPLQLKLIACNLFQREACLCLAHTPQLVDPEFVELGAHVNPARLRALLQARIDSLDAGTVAYDAVLLLYGLCGNACVGLRAGRFPLVIPRAHDCATVLLGSRARFQEVFGDNLSRPFTSIGYYERGRQAYRAEGGVWGGDGNSYEDFVERYGEDNARYLWQTLHAVDTDGSAIYIDIPEVDRPGVQQRACARLLEEGRRVRVATGALRLIRMLIDGDWNATDFLRVPPGAAIQSVYDMEIVMKAVAPA